MIEIPIIQHGKPCGIVRLPEQMYFDVRDLALEGRSIELVAGVSKGTVVEFHIKPTTRGLVKGIEIIFTEELKNSDKEVLASIGDLGMIVGQFLDGYTAINYANGKEFFVNASKFSVIT